MENRWIFSEINYAELLPDGYDIIGSVCFNFVLLYQELVNSKFKN
jgi:hypothetical protein